MNMKKLLPLFATTLVLAGCLFPQTKKICPLRPGEMLYNLDTEKSLA